MEASHRKSSLCRRRSPSKPRPRLAASTHSQLQLPPLFLSLRVGSQPRARQPQSAVDGEGEEEGVDDAEGQLLPHRQHARHRLPVRVADGRYSTQGPHSPSWRGREMAHHSSGDPRGTRGPRSCRGSPGPRRGSSATAAASPRLSSACSPRASTGLDHIPGDRLTQIECNQ